MDKKNIRLNEECHKCVELSKGICRGKESRVPCLVYKSKNQYQKDAIESIKKMLKN